VQKHQRLARTSLHVVKTDTVHIEKLTLWRIIVLRLLSKVAIQKCRRRQRSRCDNCN
jgi:hypothetical protein